ncbi:CLUMA_CG012531, isoform A [Clunio marinus]|uniref:CLUMA_CG012531, isoform A n=1 Tax=Clunio marinus TaxID=568069 RepID=A0A1J1IHB7_9DIPT|nr:CLUMA_CG012531, isoform A [Clunio marinus]
MNVIELNCNAAEISHEILCLNINSSILKANSEKPNKIIKAILPTHHQEQQPRKKNKTKNWMMDLIVGSFDILVMANFEFMVMAKIPKTKLLKAFRDFPIQDVLLLIKKTLKIAPQALMRIHYNHELLHRLKCLNQQLTINAHDQR